MIGHIEKSNWRDAEDNEGDCEGVEVEGDDGDSVEVEGDDGDGDGDGDGDSDYSL